MFFLACRKKGAANKGCPEIRSLQGKIIFMEFNMLVDNVYFNCIYFYQIYIFNFQRKREPFKVSSLPSTTLTAPCPILGFLGYPLQDENLNSVLADLGEVTGHTFSNELLLPAFIVCRSACLWKVFSEDYGWVLWADSRDITNRRLLHAAVKTRH